MSSLIATKSKTSAQDDLRALAEQLKGLGLAGVAASLLESGAGFGVLGAQALYLGQPLLGVFLSEERLQSWASRLEDPAAMQTLVAYLREVPA